MCRHVVLVGTDVSVEHIASILRVKSMNKNYVSNSDWSLQPLVKFQSWYRIWNFSCQLVGQSEGAHYTKPTTGRHLY
jgi:hypothetical protein